MNINGLTRSKNDRMISGVCGGIARTFGLDAVVVRGVFVVLALVNIGITAIVYVVAIFVLPEEQDAPLVGGTQRPGWRFDPWTGESLARTATETVIVDTAPTSTGAPTEQEDVPINESQPSTLHRPNDDEV
jgi:phage shock protein C